MLFYIQVQKSNSKNEGIGVFFFKKCLLLDTFLLVQGGALSIVMAAKKLIVVFGATGR